jgi:hypothetical protein
MAGTARAQARVHPFVGGMYGERSQSLAPAVEEVGRRVVGQWGVANPTPDGETVMARAPGMSGNPTSQKRDAHPNQQADRELRNVGPPVVGPPETEGERFEALLPEVVGEGTGFVRPKQEGEALGDGVAEKATATHPLATRLRKNGPPSAQGEAVEWKFEPVVGEARGEGSNEASAVLHPAGRDGAVKDGAAGFLPPVHGDKGTTNGAPMLRRLAQPTSQKRDVGNPQGDEIQIHIGRIEVIAMPPAAPRPAAGPARKTQTLDEYLRQRNGRTG